MQTARLDMFRVQQGDIIHAVRAPVPLTTAALQHRLHSPSSRRTQRLRRRRTILGPRRQHRTGAEVRTALPLGDISPQLLELILEALAEDVDVVGRAVVDAPDEDGEQEGGAGPPVPEPERAGHHRAERVRVLHEHEGGLLERVREGEDQSPDPGFRV